MKLQLYPAAHNILEQW